MITELQKKAAKAIIEIFENGTYSHVDAYSGVSNMKGDTGGLSYGIAQSSLTSGNLGLLIQKYVACNGQYAKEFAPYVAPLLAKDISLNNDQHLAALLAVAGADPIMQDTQDIFFDMNFWTPAVNTVTAYGFTKPLSMCVAYDGRVQGAWGIIRDETNRQFAMPTAANEVKWISTYVSIRRNWLEGNINTALHNTVYRMDTFVSLIKTGNWNLDLPLIANGVAVTESRLMSSVATAVKQPPASGVLFNRTLKLTKPPMTGPDVLALQTAISKLLPTLNLLPDGQFGQLTQNAVMVAQVKLGIKNDGVVGPLTLKALNLGT